MRRSAWQAVTLVVVACASITFPDRDPSLEGEIVGQGAGVPFANGSTTKIWVKAQQDSPCGIVFETTHADIGERRSDGSVRRRTRADLETGKRVRVWSGPVAESCPGQSSATDIELL